MIEITATAEVELPADELFAFVADMSNNPRWQRGMQRCSWITASPMQVGSRYRQHARFLGRELVSTFEVTEFDADRRIRIRTIESPMPLDITREVEPIDDDRSRVRATIRGGPTGVLELLDPITKMFVQRSVRGDYERLRELLDGRG